MRFDLEGNVYIVSDPLLAKKRVLRLNIILGIAEPLLVVPVVIYPKLFVELLILFQHGLLILIPSLELSELPLSDFLDLFVVKLVLFAGFLFHFVLQIKEVMIPLLFLDLLDLLLIDFTPTLHLHLLQHHGCLRLYVQCRTH